MLVVPVIEKNTKAKMYVMNTKLHLLCSSHMSQMLHFRNKSQVFAYIK